LRQAIAGNTAAVRYGLIGLSLFAAIAFLPRLVRRLKGEAALRWIEVDELAARFNGNKDMNVIDVRGPEEFIGPLGHIAQARNLPLDELAGRNPGKAHSSNDKAGFIDFA
jgi:hypothetical protein